MSFPLTSDCGESHLANFSGLDFSFELMNFHKLLSSSPYFLPQHY